MAPSSTGKPLDAARDYLEATEATLRANGQAATPGETASPPARERLPRNPAALRRLARAHGIFNVVTGLWPLASRRTFEAVTGRKRDWWLVQTVGLLLAVIGTGQVAAARREDALVESARLGMGTAGALMGIDLAYALRHRISRVYLLDAAAQGAWVAAWAKAVGRGAARDG